VSRLREEVQLVLTDRSKLTEGRDFGVWSLRTWRVGDLASSRRCCSGARLGADAAAHGRCRPRRAPPRPLWPADWSSDAVALPLQLLRRADAAPGPAATWMIEHLIAGCRSVAAERATPVRRGAGRPADDLPRCAVLALSSSAMRAGGT